MQCKGPVTCLAWSEETPHKLACLDGSLRLFDVAAGVQTRVITMGNLTLSKEVSWKTSLAQIKDASDRDFLVVSVYQGLYAIAFAERITERIKGREMGGTSVGRMSERRS